MSHRDIIIGDIHGCIAELEQLLDELAVTESDRVISVGDLVDRGPDSRAVWKLFAERPEFVAIMGNHERKHVRGVLSFSQEIVKLQLGDDYAAFRRWSEALPYSLETDHAIVVHGGFEVGVPLDQQREDVLAATTSGCRHLDRLYDGQMWAERYEGPKPIVFGHHVVGEEAKRYPHAIGIDTGACHGGYLTALVLPSFALHRVEARRDHWRHERRRWLEPVNRARPWGSYRFAKLERELTALRRDHETLVAELEAWLEEVRRCEEALPRAAAARVRALEALYDDPKALKRAIAAESSASLLFAARAGSLDRDALRAALPTPDAVLAAARALGVPGRTDGEHDLQL